MISLVLLADPARKQIAVIFEFSNDLPLPHVCEQGLHAVHLVTLQTATDFHEYDKEVISGRAPDLHWPLFQKQSPLHQLAPCSCTQEG